MPVLAPMRTGLNVALYAYRVGHCTGWQLLTGSAHTPNALDGPFHRQRRVAEPTRPDGHVVVVANEPAVTTAVGSK